MVEFCGRKQLFMFEYKKTKCISHEDISKNAFIKIVSI